MTILWLINLPKVMSIYCWNVALTFIIPNDIHLNVNVTHFVLNVVFNLSHFATRTWFYPKNLFNSENISHLDIMWSICSINNMG